MWALRRSAYPLKERCQSIVVARTCCAYSNLANNLEPREEHPGKYSRARKFVLSKRFSCASSSFAKSFLWSRNLSSKAGAKSSDREDDLDDGFSELEVASEGEKERDVLEKEDDEDLMSEDDGLDKDSNAVVDSSLDLLDTESDVSSTKGEWRKRPYFPLIKIIIEAPPHSVRSELDNWVEKGNELGRSEVSLVMLHLRRRRLFAMALQFAEWLEARKLIELVERDYASHLDLVAKVFGLQKAEKYIEKVPNPFKGEVIYRTLLANCVTAVNVKKAEDVLKKIKDLGFPLSIFACNQLLLLYKRVDRKKIADVLLMMEKENLKPSLFTYRLLIDTKGRANDISGMEQIVEAMKAEGVEPDIYVQAIVVKYYINADLKEKAVAALEDMEGDDLKENRAVCRELLPLYAALGSPDDVGRVWEVCKSNPRLDECIAAIEAWGKVGKIENAEEVFETMVKSWKKLSSRYYNSLLKVYANNKLLDKGKELVKRMVNDGCSIGPLTWDALVKLYVNSGEVEKAGSLLQASAQQNKGRAFFSSYIAVLDNYAHRGDVHNAEKIFYRMRQAGYVGIMKQYQSLLQAYVNAKTPAYGFRERMKADNVTPNKPVAAQLVAVDAFKNAQISDLLD